MWKGGSKGSFFCNIIYERHRQGSWIWIFIIHNLNLQALIKCLIKMTFKRSNKWNGSNFHNFLKISAYNHRIVSIIFNIFMSQSFVSFQVVNLYVILIRKWNMCLKFKLTKRLYLIFRAFELRIFQEFPNKIDKKS